MTQDSDHYDGPQRNRQSESARINRPSASRSTKPKKKNATGFGGVHRRRNKHWSW